MTIWILLILGCSRIVDQEVDRILVDKSERRLLLLKDGEIVKSYKVAFGRNPKGHKVKKGDCRTPEGKYFIDGKNPKSKYHLSMHISYPNRKDKERAIQNGYDPGGDITIHGSPRKLGWMKGATKLVNWTAGCIAVTNEEIEEIYSMVDIGTPIEIRP